MKMGSLKSEVCIFFQYHTKKNKEQLRQGKNLRTVIVKNEIRSYVNSCEVRVPLATSVLLFLSLFILAERHRG